MRGCLYCVRFLGEMQSGPLMSYSTWWPLHSFVSLRRCVRSFVCVSLFLFRPVISTCSELSDLVVDDVDADVEGEGGASGEGKVRTACSRAPALIVRVLDSWPVMTFVSIITIWALVGVCKRTRLCRGK